jgi:hypothetical protein
VDNVSAHIGYEPLRSKIYDIILPLWNEYTGGWPFTREDFTMLNKYYVEIKKADRDVIAQQFFVTKGKGSGVLHFKTGVCAIYAVVHEEILRAWEEHVDAEYIRVQDEKEVPSKKIQKHPSVSDSQELCCCIQCNNDAHELIAYCKSWC